MRPRVDKHEQLTSSISALSVSPQALSFAVQPCNLTAMIPVSSSRCDQLPGDSDSYGMVVGEDTDQEAGLSHRWQEPGCGRLQVRWSGALRRTVSFSAMMLLLGVLVLYSLDQTAPRQLLEDPQNYIISCHWKGLLAPSWTCQAEMARVDIFGEGSFFFFK